jgi:hypothetical protein
MLNNMTPVPHRSLCESQHINSAELREWELPHADAGF